MSPNAQSEAVHSVRRAISRVRTHDPEGPRPIEEIVDAVEQHGDDVDAALAQVVRTASADDLPSAIRLVGLLRRRAALDAVRQVAFEGPSAIDAKRQAVAAIQQCADDVATEITQRMAVVDAFESAPDGGSLATLLEWPDAWRRPALVGWLAAAGPEQLEAVEIALGVDAELDATLLDWIAGQASVEAATALQKYLTQTDDKNRVKQIKKALHSLRSQGVRFADAPVGEEAPRFSLAIEEEEEALRDAKAYLTSIDGEGARLVWVLWRAPTGGSRLLQAMIDDVQGVCEAEVSAVTRSGVKEYIEQMRESPTVLVQQVALEAAGEVLAAAAAVTTSRGAELPEDCGKFLALAGIEPSAAGPAPIYDHIGADEVRDNEALLNESMTLLREPHFQPWALSGALIEDAADEVHKAETSTLMVSDEQRRERMQEAIRDAVGAAFDDSTRRRYRARLEYMAYLLWKRGERDAARQALAAGVGLTEIRDLFRGHPFARAVTHRGVWIAYQEKQRELQAEQQRSQIVQP